MSTGAQPDKLSLLIAEEVLRTIYGDDFKGCTASLDDIAAVIHNVLQQKQAQTRELLGLYEKVVEAVHLLSTPPDVASVSDPNTLRSLLSDRLDAIHVVATKTMATVALAKPEST